MKFAPIYWAVNPERLKRCFAKKVVYDSTPPPCDTCDHASTCQSGHGCPSFNAYIGITSRRDYRELDRVPL